MRSFLIAALVLLAPALAAADGESKTQPQPSRAIDAVKMKSDDCARARKAGKTCVLDMGSEDIEGGVTKPEGTGINVIGFGDKTSLIRIRRDFITEIIKSAEDLD